MKKTNPYTSVGRSSFVVLLAASLSAQVTERASLNSAGVEGGFASGFSALSISADGRYVAFRSMAENLAPNDLNGLADVFVRDRRNGTTERVSLSSAGVATNGASSAPSISADGRYVAFVSEATNLVPSDFNSWADVFVRDRLTGTTERASVNSVGAEVSGASSAPSISADGRYVAFASVAWNLVPADTNLESDVFVRDRQTGITERVSVDSSAVQGNSLSISPSISADGRYVAFASLSSNLVSGDTNGFDIFVRDRQTGTTELVSLDSSGTQANDHCDETWISADGRHVAFRSEASNLVLGDTNDRMDLFVRDRLTGSTERVSVDSAEAESNHDSYRPSMSADARYVAFMTQASNLVAGDANGEYDVFVRDRLLGTTERVSVDSAGMEAKDACDAPKISADGACVAFYSAASNLVSGDLNQVSDAFVRNVNEPGASFCAGDGSLVTACPCAPPDTVPAPSGSPGHGCANSFDLNGAILSVSGSTAPDTIRFIAVLGGNSAAFGLLLKGNASDSNGVANGDGVRCVDGQLIRFGGHNAGTNGAHLGTWTYPNSVQTNPVSLATLQPPGQAANYQLYYRNLAPSFCSPATTNMSNGMEIDWP